MNLSPLSKSKKAHFSSRELPVDTQKLLSPLTTEIRVAVGSEKKQTHTVQISRSDKSFRKIAGKNGLFCDVKLFEAEGVHVFLSAAENCKERGIVTERLIEKNVSTKEHSNEKGAIEKSLCHILAPKAAAAARVVVVWDKARWPNTPRPVIEAVQRDRSVVRLLDDQAQEKKGFC